MAQYRYKTDEEIEAQYAEYRVTETKRYSEYSGGMQIEFDNYEDRWDSFILYDNGNIAFENWYPPEVYKALCKKALEILGETT